MVDLTGHDAGPNEGQRQIVSSGDQVSIVKDSLMSHAID